MPTSTNRIVSFVDTSAWYAARDDDDANHIGAAHGFQRLGEQGCRLLTTDHVVAESATLIRRRLGYDEARAFLEALQEARSVGLLEVYFTASPDLEAAIAYFLATGDPKLSLVDALSLVVCRARAVRLALAFDEHFREAGIELVVAPASR